MTHLWIDASAGVAGDMLLGALLDAGADPGTVQQAVDAVVAASVRIGSEQVDRAGQRATKAIVELLTDDPPHRTWTAVRSMIEESTLARPVRDMAMAVFQRLAEAEGRVHGIPSEQVHFHEVGALDSIADVVGVCAALVELGIDSVSAGPVAVGSGHVRTAHGRIPVPVPAVAELARGWQVVAGGEGELTTPTGMALVAALATRCEHLPGLVLERVGVGAGTRNPDSHPNVTRILAGRLVDVPSAPGVSTAGVSGRVDSAAAVPRGDLGTPPAVPVVVLACNVDDMDPRLWPGVLRQLLSDGADDAWLTPILMKKGRPAHTFSVLCSPERSAVLRNRIFEMTSTIGIRCTEAEKYALSRLWIEVDVEGLPVQLKVAHHGGTIRQVSVEFESMAARALELGRPEHEVLHAALLAADARGWRAGLPLPETSPDR